MTSNSSSDFGRRSCPMFGELDCGCDCSGREPAQIRLDLAEDDNFIASGCSIDIPRLEDETSRSWQVRKLYAAKALNMLHEKLCPELIGDEASLGTFWGPDSMLEDNTTGLHMAYKQPNFQIPEICMYQLIKHRYEDYVSTFLSLERFVLASGRSPVCIVLSDESNGATPGSSAYPDVSRNLMAALKFAINSGVHTAGAILSLPNSEVGVTLPNLRALSKISRSSSRYVSHEDKYVNARISSVSESVDMIELTISECSTDLGFRGATKAFIPRVLFEQCRNLLRDSGVKEVRDMKDKWISFHAFPSYRSIHWTGSNRTGALIKQLLRVDKRCPNSPQKLLALQK